MRRASILAVCTLAFAGIASAGGFGPHSPPPVGVTVLRAAGAPAEAVVPAATTDPTLEGAAVERSKWRWPAAAAVSGVALLVLVAGFVFLTPAPSGKRARLPGRGAPRAPPWRSPATA